MKPRTYDECRRDIIATHLDPAHRKTLGWELEEHDLPRPETQNRLAAARWWEEHLRQLLREIL